jgi:CubicO group peptidase (beta-lactamase class C family)
VAIASALSAVCVNAQIPKDTDVKARVDTLAQTLLSRNIAGVSIAVARNGKVTFAAGYGLANLQHSVAVTPKRLSHRLDLKKYFVAVLLQLVDEGKLALDDDVTKYVPEAPTQGRRITVRQLLNHTSGIYNFTSLPEAEANERLDLTHEQVLALFKDKPFDFEPGAGWRYNNSAFYIAGMVVERVTKQSTACMCASTSSSRWDDLSADVRRSNGRSAYRIRLRPRSRSLVNAAFLSWKLPFAAGAICATAPIC